jgi:hypothetical protein
MTPRILSSKEWRLGPDWPGQRCGAKTRSGHPCKNPIVSGRKRCRMHGGAAGSGAPTGKRHGRYKHGRYAKEYIARRRENAAQLREIHRIAKLCGFYG